MYTSSPIRTKIFHVPFSKRLFTRQVVIEDRIFKHLHNSLQLRPAQYNFSELLAKTFVIPNEQNQYNHENIFNNAPIRRLAIAMNTNTGFTGSLKTNPFLYHKFNLRSIRIVRGSHVVVERDTTDNVESYITTMRALSLMKMVLEFLWRNTLSISFKCLISLLLKKQMFRFTTLMFSQPN